MGVYLLLSRNEWASLPAAQRADPRLRVLVSTAISGGTLRAMLEEAVRAYGAGHILLDVQRLRMSFPLPCPSGEGVSLSETAFEALRREAAGPVFYSGELCAKYFLCRSGDGMRLILFDDAQTLREKLRLARQLGIRDASLLYPDFQDGLP